MIIKLAIALAIVLIMAAFPPARHLPGNRARHLRIRLHRADGETRLIIMVYPRPRSIAAAHRPGTLLAPHTASRARSPQHNAATANLAG